MAELAETAIKYDYGDDHKSCADCGERRVTLPAQLPSLGDDFDWNIRDYDGFRLFMLEELAARFQERDSWAPADMEVVLVETLAVVLDQLSDMLDRVHAEAFLETARRPDSVRRLLAMIGYQPGYGNKGEKREEAIQTLEQEWTQYPHKMEEAKKAGPKSIHQQQRMVTLDDYSTQLGLHPLVLSAAAYSQWRGSWNTHYAVVLLHNNQNLDTKITDENFITVIKNFHTLHSLPEPDSGQTARTLLRPYIDQQRMAGQEVILQDAKLTGIFISISIRIAGDYFQSEIKEAVRMALSEQSGGYFEPGRLQFGEDVVASDIIETLMKLEGVEAVCLNLFKRMGKNYQDQSSSGRIELQGYEIAVCSNNSKMPKHGFLKMVVHGGNKG